MKIVILSKWSYRWEVKISKELSEVKLIYQLSEVKCSKDLNDLYGGLREKYAEVKNWVNVKWSEVEWALNYS